MSDKAIEGFGVGFSVSHCRKAEIDKDNPDSALDVQIGGDHYRSCKIQPVEFIEANQLGFLEGCAIKRLVRHNKPSGKGRQDIEKAIHELQLILQLRYPGLTDDAIK